jgi:hypothetical protein
MKTFPEGIESFNKATEEKNILKYKIKTSKG